MLHHYNLTDSDLLCVHAFCQKEKKKKKHDMVNLSRSRKIHQGFSIYQKKITSSPWHCFLAKLGMCAYESVLS